MRRNLYLISFFITLFVVTYVVSMLVMVGDEQLDNLLDGDVVHADLGIRMGGQPGQEFTHTVKIRNKGSKTIRITSSKVSCSCTEAIVPRNEIEPNEDIQIRLVFNDPTKGLGGYYNGTAVFETSDGERTGNFGVEYVGFDLSGARSIPKVVTFPVLDAGTPSPLVDVLIFLPSITVNGQDFSIYEDLHVTRITTPHGIKQENIDITGLYEDSMHLPTKAASLPSFSGIPETELYGAQRRVKALRQEVEDSGGKFWTQLGLRLSVPDPRDTIRGDIVVLTNHDDVALNIPLIAEVREKISIAPISIVSTGKKAQAREKTVTIRANDGSNLEILSTSSEPDVLEITVERLAHNVLAVTVVPRKQFLNDDEIKTAILIQTNFGTKTVPYLQFLR